MMQNLMVSNLKEKDKVDSDLPEVAKEWLTSPKAQHGLRLSYMKRSLANK
jgi:hypothetical protein